MARYVVCALVLAFLAGGLALVHQPFVRVTEILAEGPGSEAARLIAQRELAGSYYFIVPKNSVFFLPVERIRAAVLESEPYIIALSVKRTSFTTLTLTPSARTNSFVWCGVSPEASGSVCYDVDIEGLVFRESTAASSTSPTYLRVYGGLDRELAPGESPVRSRIAYSSALPDAFKFVKTIQELGEPVSALVLRGDEADIVLQSGTRIIYVLGREQQAAALAASTLPTVSLEDGSIDYVDLRFSGRAYVKRY